MPAPAPDHDALERLCRRLEGLPEAAMRREALLVELEGREPEPAYRLLSGALARSDLETLERTAHEVLARGGALRPFAYALRAALYAEAAARGDTFVARLLRSPQAAESMADPSAALPRDVAELPLGRRRSLAKGDDRHLLEKLLLDPDAIVVGHLLENPRIREDDVVRLAARRPVPAPTLGAIHASRRFGARPRVRQALAGNPYCPTDVALEAMAPLPGPVLRDLARDETLHPDVRRHAREQLDRRSAPAREGS